MDKRAVIAIDLGASGGRVMRAGLRDGRMLLTEIHRFGNTPVTRTGQLRWDDARLLGEIKRGAQIAAAEGFESLGIDTWGVDFALVGPGGTVAPPVCYRDARTQGTRRHVAARIEERALFRRTGVQPGEINTLYQLTALQQSGPSLLPPDASLLLMPDYFGWLLTGNITAERSIASTTQLLNPVTQDWDFGLIRLLGIPETIFPAIQNAGGILGEYAGRPVISVLGHDTQSAALAVPAREESFLYISCGTWSIVGTERESAVCTDEAFAFGLSNEIGYGGKAQLLRNITGLWLLQETRRHLNERDGCGYSYARLEAMAAAQPPFAYLVDPDAAAFAPPGDMPARIRAHAGREMSDAQVLRCIYDSLAMKYRWAVEGIEAVTNERREKIYMVGGGAQSALLCQMTADVLHRPVVAGPVEATAIGNAAVQMIALGLIPDAAAARGIIRESFPVATYEPEEPRALIDEAYEKFKQTIERQASQ